MTKNEGLKALTSQDEIDTAYLNIERWLNRAIELNAEGQHGHSLTLICQVKHHLPIIKPTRPTVTPTDGDEERALEILCEYAFSGYGPRTQSRCTPQEVQKAIEAIRAALQSTRKPINEDAERALNDIMLSLDLNEWDEEIKTIRTAIKTSTTLLDEKCSNCGGDGWYTWGHPDMPEQKQCDECCGTGHIPPVPVDTINIKREAIEALKDQIKYCSNGSIHTTACKFLEKYDAK